MNTKLAIAIVEARKALENLQVEIKNEVMTEMQPPATNDLLVRASQNHIQHAQGAIDKIGDQLVKNINVAIDRSTK